MPHSTNREMILGIVVGAAGISLLLLWYHKVRKPRTAMALPKFLSLGNSLDLMTLQDEMPSGQGTTAIFQGRHPWHMGSSWIRDQTHVSRTGRQILYC